MRIRAAERGDIDEIVRLCAAHAAYEHADYQPATKAQKLGDLLFASPPRLFCRVVEIGTSIPSELTGYATWSEEISTWDAGPYVHMDCLYLEPRARGLGIGRRLMAQIVRDAMARGCHLVQWQTPAFNTSAIRFYDRLGATRKDKVRFYLAAESMERLGSD
jgi:ribosomal protein S18 acetylase RimI-like enzyme